MSNPMRPFDDVRAALLAAAKPVSAIEQVPTAEALGRVLAVDQVSSLNVPPLDNSSMDGYAVNTADVTAPGARLTVAQRIPAGSVGHTLVRGTAARIFGCVNSEPPMYTATKINTPNKARPKRASSVSGAM